MARTVSRSQRTFSVAVGLALILAFLPTSWLMPWTSYLGGGLDIFVQPAGEVGISFRNWLRPAHDPLREEPQRVQQLIEGQDELRRLLHFARLRIDTLEEEMRELQDAQRFHKGVVIDPLFARITGRSPDRAHGLIRLNVGTRDGVTQGTIAVFRGVHLIGRVAGDVARLSSWLVPITNPSNGRVGAIILPADDPLAPIEAARRIWLEPNNTGALVGDLDKDVLVRDGDIVRLHNDPSWVDSAQGMILGFVESVTANDRKPLLNSIVVRPRYPADRLAYVTLKIEREVVLTEGVQP